MTRPLIRSGSAVIVFLKAPVPGTVKTRLMPRFSADEAADLYRAMVEDLLARLDRFEGVAVRVCFAPPRAGRSIRAWLGRHVGLEPQRGGDLGARMSAAFKSAFRAGFDRVVLVGSDVPGLTPRVLSKALAALHDNDVVLGPSPDGGYYLIGMTEARIRLFSEMPWSTRRVLRETLRRASTLGVSVEVLAPLEDIDTAADARRLWRDMQSGRVRSSSAPRVANVLRKILGARLPRAGAASGDSPRRRRPRT